MNIIAENIYLHMDKEGRLFVLLSEIVDAYNVRLESLKL
jgi:hypothetical protein